MSARRLTNLPANARRMAFHQKKLRARHSQTLKQKSKRFKRILFRKQIRSLPREILYNWGVTAARVFLAGFPFPAAGPVDAPASGPEPRSAVAVAAVAAFGSLIGIF